MPVRIVSIKKDRGNHYNPHLAIEEFYWENEKGSGYSSQKEMQDFLLAHPKQAYVEDGHNDVVYLHVMKTSLGHRYVATYPDGKKADNLLNLPEHK